MKKFDEIDIYLINQLMEIAMQKRGFILYVDDCLKLDLHHYYEDNPVSIEIEDNGLTSIKIRVKIYHNNQELFIPYCYKAIITENGFIERHSFSEEYLYILKIIRKLIHESGVYDYIKQTIN
jgi:hypothetical protein